MADESLAAAIRECLPGQPVTILTGVLADKDFGQMYDALAPLAARFITVTPPNPRALDAGELAAFLDHRIPYLAIPDTLAACLDRLAERLADSLDELEALDRETRALAAKIATP